MPAPELESQGPGNLGKAPWQRGVFEISSHTDLHLNSSHPTCRLRDLRQVPLRGQGQRLRREGQDGVFPSEKDKM